ncbi:MAG: RlmE family RNA methyltransferase [Oceanococcus sp.]
MKRKASSARWLERQRKDRFVKQAQDAGWRSRAVYKLEEIDLRDQLIKPGQRIVDLGAAPGGWCQYAARKLRGQGTVIGLDLLAIEPLEHVHFIEGDFLQPEILERLSQQLNNLPIDLVLSDMAPNFSGIRGADLARSYELAELASDFAVEHLSESGRFLVKVFQGADFENYRAQLRQRFKRVVSRKPDASRTESREVYLLASDPIRRDND